MDPGFVELGLEPVNRRRDERVRFQRIGRRNGAMSCSRRKRSPTRRLRVLVVGRISGSGLSSGAAVDSEWALT